jgi:hypothetical protein
MPAMRIKWLQLHSDLLRTTIMKDFVEFEGISKCVGFDYRLAMLL